MTHELAISRTPRAAWTLRFGALALCAGAVLASSAAEASPTFSTSVGSSVVVGDGSRGPLTFELGPGWQLGAARIELPIVLGAFGDVTFPRHSDGFLGLRPTLKVFPIDEVYVKVAAQFLTPQDQPLHLGVSVGGGVELKLARMVGLFGEVAVSPFFVPETAIPLEARAGLTVRF